MTCPHCGNECEWEGPSWVGDLSDPRLCVQEPARWICAECEFAEDEGEPEDDDE